MAIRSLSASVSELASTFAGELLQPQDPGYDLAEGPQRIDRQRRADCTVRGTADIVDAEAGSRAWVGGGGPRRRRQRGWPLHDG